MLYSLCSLTFSALAADMVDDVMYMYDDYNEDRNGEDFSSGINNDESTIETARTYFPETWIWLNEQTR